MIKKDNKTTLNKDRLEKIGWRKLERDEAKANLQIPRSEKELEYPCHVTRPEGIGGTAATLCFFTSRGLDRIVDDHLSNY
jgi:hypothetical protein